MHHCLIVANQTLGGEQLLEAVRARVRDQPCSFYVLVPNTPLRHLAASAGFEPLPGWTPTTVPWATQSAESQSQAAEHARRRLERMIQLLREAGAEAQGEVSGPDPMKATEELLAEREFDEVIISTLPERFSHWLRLDFPSRLRRHVQMPVTVVTPKDTGR